LKRNWRRERRRRDLGLYRPALEPAARNTLLRSPHG
jgi:hypothetical protein